MKILKAATSRSFTIKKSKFYCFGYFVKTKDEVKDIIHKTKKEYPDASHICYAYILSDQEYYFTDAGEPSGTAGQPIYNALVTNDLNYCLFVVVRYFGGIKFGPGPLRQTFKSVTVDTLKQANISVAQITDLVEIEIDFDQLKIVKAIFNKQIYKQVFEKEFIKVWLSGDQKTIIDKLKRLKIKPKTIKEKEVV